MLGAMSKALNRRRTDLTNAEQAYQGGLRRRASDTAERRAYYGLLMVLLGLFLSIGVAAWLAR